MLQSRSVKRASLIDHLRSALTGEKNHFFADTSFLIAAASLNPAARSELRRWLDSLGDRFHVPAWVAHEVYGKITSSTDLFAPMAKVAGDAISAVEALQVEARRYIDTDRARDFWGRPDRVGYLAELDRAAKPLIDHAQTLKRAKQTIEEATEFLVELVNGAILPSDIYSGLPQLDADYAARVIGGQPPGFMDKGKAERTRHGDNRYGDLIIWREIIEFVRSTELTGVVLLTNDNKADWVYVPPTILDEEGRALNNEARKGFKIILPLPLLCHELAGAREGAEFTISNLGMVSQMLHQIGVDAQNLFSAYQPIATIVPQEQAEPDDGEVVPGAEPEGEAAPIIEVRTETTADLPDLLRALTGSDVEAAAAAAAPIRQMISTGLSPETVPQLAQGLVMGAEHSIEAAAIIIREVVTDVLTLSKDYQTRLLGAMLAALYYDGDGKLRDRPLGGALPDLFGLQRMPELKTAVEELNARLGPSRRYYLLTPDAAAPVLALSVSIERDEDDRQKLRAVYFGETPLLEDVATDSDRSLTRLFGGRGEATGGELRRVLSEYFRVPEGQLDLGISRFETIRWDSLTGLIDWGVDSGLQLR